jgi:hypothetical protein
MDNEISAPLDVTPVMFAMVRFSAMVMAVAGIACNANPSPHASATEQASAAEIPMAPGAAVATPILPKLTPEPAIDDTALRRSYGPVDMKLAQCVTLDKEGTLLGSNCPSNFVVFGPYVGAPGNSNLRVSFEIQSDGPIAITSDAISEVGKRFHGVMDEQSIGSGEKRKLGYGIHLFEPVTALEARIGIRADKPVKFKITNLKIQVQ